MNDIVDFWAVDNLKMTVILLSVFDDILMGERERERQRETERERQRERDREREREYAQIKVRGKVSNLNFY